MARTKQKLINYHSSGNTPLDLTKVEYGEIAVRHLTGGNAELIVKTSENTSAVFVESAKVQSMISNSTEIELINQSLDSFSGMLASVSATVYTDHEPRIESLEGKVCANTESIDAIESDIETLNQTLTSEYWTSAETEAKITEINGTNEQLGQKIDAVSGGLLTLSGVVASDYATKEEMTQGDSDTLESAKDYTDEASGNIETHLQATYWTSAETQAKITTINNNNEQLGQKIDAVSGGLLTLSGVVASDYATKEEMTQGDSDTLDDAKDYTDEASGNIETHLQATYWTSAETQEKITTINNANEQLGQKIDAVSGDLLTLSGSVVSMSGSVKNYIDGRLSTVYKFKGSVSTYAGLEAITDKENGDVYNVEGAQGTIGQPGYVPAGTNYAWNETGNTWDALGGTIDLSNYATTDQLASAVSISNEISQSLEAVSGGLLTLSGAVVSDYATKTEMTQGDTDTLAAASAYTKTVSGNIETHLQATYWTSAETQAKITTINNNNEQLGQKIDAVSGGLLTLSGVVASDYATKEEVEQGDTDTLAAASAYTKTVSGNIETHLQATYWTSAETQAKITTINNNNEQLGQKIDAVSGGLLTLSGSVVSIEPKANSALQGFELTGDSATTTGTQSTQSGAKANYTTGGTATLDLSELIIDCGDW